MNNTAFAQRLRCVPFLRCVTRYAAVGLLATALTGTVLNRSLLAQSDEAPSSPTVESNTPRGSQDESGGSEPEQKALTPPSTATADPTATATATSGASSAAITPEIRQWVKDLTAEQFATRQKALVSLRECSPDQLRPIGTLITSEGSTEAQRRWLELLELQYASLDLKSDALMYVSETLEQAVKSETWFVSETAIKVLDRQWKRRVTLAVVQLQRLNVPTDPKDPLKLWEEEEDEFGDPTSSNHLKLVIDHQFPDNPEVANVMRRLAPLRSTVFLRSEQLVSVIIVDGHQLSDTRLAEILGIFGDIAVQQRGPACLGISPDNQLVNGVGVRVRSVAKNKSAHLAGLKSGDLIIDLDGEPLQSFDDMVKRLRGYQIGDKVKLQVISPRSPRSVGPVEMEVTLTGWYEGATNAPETSESK